ncbi:Uncharacterized protein putative in bacteria [Rubellimicrobium thermophilum DSM 16684]|uniref:Uncharacterized protein putative in bacteria n=1 Tax=Rubellimicrobium thermophilum DSM 16684 TaxID=1123069 RepID=S9S925_9RHOB|nr:DUF1800 domain-containing protein [Rubellimicrobium thermophilum]EPX82769.1 Uncharacterized protein putative in bacteria [Rubellimicrobium thermophilum DSM 16684]
MTFDPHLAAIRFGTGLSPYLPPPSSIEAMLERLAGPDVAARAIPAMSYTEALAIERAFAQANRQARNGETAAIRAAARAERDRLRRLVEPTRLAQFRTVLARQVASEDALRERLLLFWANHFTARPKTTVAGILIAPYVEEAIRPHVAGRFADMLTAVALHPVMVAYLDQARSIGPGSIQGRQSGRGLNENYARELLELHTVGVGGGYTQEDVRQLALLLTGVTVAEGQTVYRPRWAEPGAETVLGRTYPAEADLATVQAVLADLAVRPETARHLARKLAVHFVSDAPEERLVEALAGEWLASGGDLLAVTGALLRHPAAWSPRKDKVKPPVDFIASALRALGLGADFLLPLGFRETRRLLANPLAVMGQPWQDPPGPDGWPEAPEAWITPQFMAARIDWAMNRPEEMQPDLPDPRDFVRIALGPAAREEVIFAAHAAERPSEAIGVILASSDFQRR